ncbi:MAG: hypothetical protein IJA91_03090, partial [Clostridia bacterium]|nr:hypothetical protein [Clostridia bacterium]
LEFLNPDSLAHVNEHLTLEADKSTIDSFRNALYSLALENREILYLVNHITPKGLAEGEVYVIVRYDRDTVELVQGQVLPTWFGSANDKFTVFDNQQYAEYNYIEHSDVTDNGDLYWCTVNQKDQIFRWLHTDSGDDVIGTEIAESLEVTAGFDKIYKINFNPDNDEIYDIDAVYTSIQTDDGTMSYKLATADRVAEVMGSVPQRNGFDLAWLVGGDRHELSELSAELALLDNADLNTLELHPVWDLRAPVIDQLTADGKTANHTAIYGNDVALKAAATAPHETISLKYEWSRDGVLCEEQDYTIYNIHPNHAGSYKLTVTAYADFTSLTKSVEGTIDVGFEKRELHFDWALPTNMVYSAEDKPITVHAYDAINEDIISARLSRDSVRDAGKYTITLELYGDTDTKYKTAAADVSKEITITPYPIDVQWGSTLSFVYDGELHAPTASVMGLNNDGALDIAVSGMEKNAGENYTAVASTSNQNYRLRENEMSYTITRRPITSIVWNSVDSFVYNAKDQGRTISSLVGWISADKNAVLSTMIYEGKETNVGDDYVITAKLPANSNYEFKCSTVAAFRITPKALTVTIDNPEKTYDGLVYSNFTCQAAGLQGADKVEEIFELSYKGEATEAINARTTGYTIDADAVPLSKFNNYSITIVKGKLTIRKRSLTVNVTNATKTYDGQFYPADSYTFTHTGLAATDSIESVLSLNYSGAALTGKNAGEYTLAATAVGAEKYSNYTVTVNPAKLTINKAPLTVTAVGGQKVYDGKLFTNFSFTASGLVNNETQSSLGSPTYSGAGKTDKGAGTHVLNVSLPSNSVTKNYDIKYVAGQVIIDKKPLTITAVGGSKTYDGKVGSGFSFQASGLVSGEYTSQLGNATYGGEATTNKNAGTHTLTVQIAANAVGQNYDITYVEGTYVINKKNVTVSIPDNEKVYDGKPTYTFNYSVTGLVSGESRDVLGEPSFAGSGYEAVNVGSYIVTVTLPGNENYNITSYSNGSLKITRAPLDIYAQAENRVYDGTSGGSFTYVAEGFVGNDTDALLGKAQYSGTALTAKNAGDYTLTVKFSAALQNYTANYIPATFTIEKANLTVTPDNMEKTYDGKGFSGYTYEVSGLVNGETKSMLGSPSWSGNATNQKTAGTYQLKVSLPNNSVTANYEITYNPATCIINKKDLTVTVRSQEKTYDGKGFSNFAFDVNGLVSGETKSMLGTPTWGGAAYTQSNAGSHVLTVSLPDNSVTANYEITYNPATCVINKKNLTVTANSQSKIYDGEVFTHDFAVSGLVSGDTKAALGNPIWGGNAATMTNVGEGELTVTLPDNAVTANYNITYKFATCKITKRALTVTAVATDRDYEAGAIGGAFDFTVEGLASTDSKNDFVATYGGSATTATNAGTYTLTVELENSGKALNYEITYVSDKAFVINEVETPAVSEE